jgi:hypothetical protein
MGPWHQDEPADRPSVAMKLEIELASLHCKLERAPYMKNKESNCHSNKCNIWSLASKGARHQDELAD